MALVYPKIHNDYLGRTMRELDNRGLINLVFDGYHNGQRGSYLLEPGFYRYVRFEKEHFVVYIEVRARNKYHVCIYTLDGMQVPWGNPTSFKRLKELTAELRNPIPNFKSYLLASK